MRPELRPQVMRRRRPKLPPAARGCRTIGDRLRALARTLSTQRAEFYPPLSVPWHYVYDVLRESKADLATVLAYALAQIICGHRVSRKDTVTLTADELRAIGEADFIAPARAFVSRNSRLIAETKLEVMASNPAELGRLRVGVWKTEEKKK